MKNFFNKYVRLPLWLILCILFIMIISSFHIGCIFEYKYVKSHSNEFLKEIFRNHEYRDYLHFEYSPFKDPPEPEVKEMYQELFEYQYWKYYAKRDTLTIESDTCNTIVHQHH